MERLTDASTSVCSLWVEPRNCALGQIGVNCSDPAVWMWHMRSDCHSAEPIKDHTLHFWMETPAAHTKSYRVSSELGLDTSWPADKPVCWKVEPENFSWIINCWIVSWIKKQREKKSAKMSLLKKWPLIQPLFWSLCWPESGGGSFILRATYLLMLRWIHEIIFLKAMNEFQDINNI